MSFNDYEYQLSKLDKEGSSSSGALQDEQEKPDVKEPNTKLYEAQPKEIQGCNPAKMTAL